MWGALVAFSLVAPQQAAPPTEWIVLGQTTFFGQTDPDSRKLPERKVDIKFPSAIIPPVDASKPHLEWDGWKVQLNEWGNLGRVYRDAGGWDEFKRLWAEAQTRIQSGNTSAWKCKAVIFKRTSVVYKASNGT